MNDNLRRIVVKCNANAVDLDVSIHLNSSNPPGDGTETYVYSTGSKAKPYALEDEPHALSQAVKSLPALG